MANRMNLTFSSTVTENAYAGITMVGLVLNQNSSVRGLDLDNSLNRGNTPDSNLISPGALNLEVYAGATWSAGLSGSFLKLYTPQGAGIPSGPTAGFLIYQEPYTGGGTVKFPIISTGTYSAPVGCTWRVYTLTDPEDDYHFGGATFSQLDLPFKQVYIPQPQIAFKNGYSGGIYNRVSAGGETFSNAAWADYTADSNNSPEISLFWEESPWSSVVGASSREWLNYDPQYFLFFYKPSKRKRKDGTQRNPGGFVHPPSIQGPTTYAQDTGPTSTGILRGYPSSVDGRVGGVTIDIPAGLTAGVSYISGWRRTEWPVGSTPSKPLRLDDGTQTAYAAFHPNQYFHTETAPDFNKSNLLPHNLTAAGNMKPWGFKGKVFAPTTPYELRNQHHIYFRFAIGISHYSAAGVRKVIFGPMSDTLRITPRAKFYGVQSVGYAIQPWVINWQARIV